jgi:hypothetical protein
MAVSPMPGEGRTGNAHREAHEPWLAYQRQKHEKAGRASKASLQVQL